MLVERWTFFVVLAILL